MAEVTEVQHQMQRRISTSGGIQIGIRVHGEAVHFTDIQDGIHGGGHLAVARLLIGHAVWVGQCISQEAGTILINEEGLQRDGIALCLHGGVHSGQIVSYQPLHGSRVSGHALHAGQIQHLATVVSDDGGVAADAVTAECVQVGGGDAVCCRHVGFDEIGNACRRCYRNAHGQYGGDQHALGNGMMMLRFFAYHFVYLR